MKKNKQKLLNFKAINIAIITYTCLYIVGLKSQAPIQEHGIVSAESMTYIAIIYFYIVLILSAFLSGRLSIENGFYNGAIVGIASIVINNIALYKIFGTQAFFSFSINNVFGVFITLLLCGLSAAIAQRWSQRK